MAVIINVIIVIKITVKMKVIITMVYNIGRK